MCVCVSLKLFTHTDIDLHIHVHVFTLKGSAWVCMQAEEENSKQGGMHVAVMESLTLSAG